MLWIVGNHRSGTPSTPPARIVLGCGLSGIAAQVHFIDRVFDTMEGCGLSGIAAQVH